MDEIKHPADPPAHPRPGHETADVNVWAIGKFAIGLTVICLVSLTLLLGLVKFFQSREETAVANPVNPRKLFPEPQLQVTPAADLRAVHAEEDKLLTGYAWVDPQKGLVRIPIEQAIDALAKRGLPSRPQTQIPGADSDVSVPTESGLGPKAQREGGPLAPGGNQPLEGTAPEPAAQQKSVVGPNKGQPEQVNSKESQKK